MEVKRKTVVGAGLAAALLCVGGILWWTLSGPSDASDAPPAFEDYPEALSDTEPETDASTAVETSEPAETSEALATSDVGGLDPARLGPRGDERTRTELRRDRSGGSTRRTTSDRADPARETARVATPDAGAESGVGEGSADGGFRSQRGYGDPLNAEVLGPRRWAAEVPQAEADAVREEIDREIPPQYPISLEDRQEAVGLASGVVHQCFDSLLARQPEISGQLVVAFELVIQDGASRLDAPRTRDVVDLEDPAFLDCIERGLLDIQFAGRRDGRMTVEYPFFLGPNARGPTR